MRNGLKLTNRATMVIMPASDGHYRQNGSMVAAILANVQVRGLRAWAGTAVMMA